MTRSVRRHRSLPILLASLLLCGFPGRSLALSRISNVSKERAQELGITVRVLPRADDVRVQVEFRTTGALKEFRYANLDVTRGGKTLVSASLMPRQPAPD